MIVWHELFTTDVGAAKSFYTELLGAEIETAAMENFEYPMLKKGDATHAGFVENPSGGEIPSQWYPYLRTDDVDGAAATAQEAWPTKPVKIVVPLAAGGTVEIRELPPGE